MKEDDYIQRESLALAPALSAIDKAITTFSILFQVALTHYDLNLPKNKR
jgi:hypothetical protein